MIEYFVLSCVFSYSPLALTGNETGLWFVGDINPQAATFSGKPQDLDYELCERFLEKQYIVVRPFTRRPAALAIGKQALWFIDDTSGIGLYKIHLPSLQGAMTSKNTSLQSSTLEAVFETDEKPTDFLMYQGQPLVAFGNSPEGVLHVFQYQDKKWNALAPLVGSHAHVALLQDQLIAAVASDVGISMWYFKEGSWLGGDELEIEGELVDLICRDDWPIFVSRVDETITLTGIQQGGLVEIASFDIPKGRWGVSSSSFGLSVVGVERKGITTVIDIGWPSGAISEPIILEERVMQDDSLLVTVLFVSMLVVSIILISKIRRPVQKTTK
jgi:hypothetical protein